MPIYPMKFAVTPEGNERIEAVVTAPKEQRSVLHGTVYDMEGKRVQDAVVRLFEKGGSASAALHAFTDENGEFIFGPLAAQKAYIAKVYVGGVKLREITVRPKKTKEEDADSEVKGSR